MAVEWQIMAPAFSGQREWEVRQALEVMRTEISALITSVSRAHLGCPRSAVKVQQQGMQVATNQQMGP